MWLVSITLPKMKRKVNENGLIMKNYSPHVSFLFIYFSSFICAAFALTTQNNLLTLLLAKKAKKKRDLRDMNYYDLTLCVC